MNVGLLFLLVRELSPTPNEELAAFGAAALLAVHPMMTEAVGYISGRSEVLCATFFLLALLSGRRWSVRGGARWAVATIGLWLAALATKETAAAFPFVFAACDGLWMTGNALRRRFVTVHLPLIVATVIAGLFRVAILGGVEYPGAVAVHWRFGLLALDVIRRYVFMLAVPSGQAAFHEVPDVGPLFGMPAMVVIVSTGLMVALLSRLRRWAPAASFGVLWFLLALLPSSTLILLGRGEPLAEHRVYLASCGLLAAGTAIRRVSIEAGRLSPWGRAMAGAALGLVLASLAADTVVRNLLWHDPVALWREAVDLRQSITGRGCCWGKHCRTRDAVVTRSSSFDGDSSSAFGAGRLPEERLVPHHNGPIGRSQAVPARDTCATPGMTPPGRRWRWSIASVHCRGRRPLRTTSR